MNISHKHLMFRSIADKMNSLHKIGKKHSNHKKHNMNHNIVEQQQEKNKYSLLEKRY